jgi:AcrR family transcriptional regulator
VARTQEARKADTRGRLVAAARRLFAARGVDAVSVDAIADEADRTSGALYAHFGSKQGLVLAVLDSMRNDLATAISADAEATELPRRLRALWRNVSRPPDEDGDLWLLLEHELWLRAAREPDVAAALASRYAAGRRQMRSSFEAWAGDAGVEPPAAPDALPTLVLALLLGLEMQHRLDPRSVSERTAVAGLAALFGAAPLPPAPFASPSAATSPRRT